MTDHPIVLASASPRRSALLTQVGIPHVVDAADVDETRFDGEPAADYVLRIARAKAHAVASRHPADRIVVAADTAVVVDGAVLGKPHDHAAAAHMLTRLAGRTHEVLTAMVVCRGDRTLERLVTTRVTMRGLSDGEIAAYCATAEPYDKAGGYGIQGRAAAFIPHIDGSYTATVGLPLSEVVECIGALRRA